MAKSCGSIILLFILSGCASIDAGIAQTFNPAEYNNKTNVDMGVIQIRTIEYKRLSGWCQHLSDINDSKDQGVNICGALLRIK